MTAYEKPEPFPLLTLAGYPVAAITSGQLRAQLIADFEQGRTRKLFFVNTNFVNQCAELKPALRSPEVILVNDGIGMDIAGMLIHGRRFPDNLNGTDFVPALLESLVTRVEAPTEAHDTAPRVFLLGAKPGIAHRAGEALAKRDITVAGALDGYGESADNDQVIARMNDSRANIILVATGNPRQEKWILQHAAAVNATLFIGVGALLDFLAGDKPRAPETVRRLRLEWLYRLSLEPRRLARRYTIDIGHFLIRCFRERA